MQKEFVKYRCLQGYCSKIIEEDKRSAHRKADHGFKIKMKF